MSRVPQIPETSNPVVVFSGHGCLQRYVGYGLALGNCMDPDEVFLEAHAYGRLARAGVELDQVRNKAGYAPVFYFASFRLVCFLTFLAGRML